MAQKRSAVITTRLAPEDRARLDIAALASGRSRCAYLRDAVTAKVAADLARLTLPAKEED